MGKNYHRETEKNLSSLTKEKRVHYAQREEKEIAEEEEQVEEKEIAEERKKKEVTRFSFGFVGISFL